MTIDEKIVIIGNGFDLNLGLKTSYADVLGYYKSKKISEEKILKQYKLLGDSNLESSFKESDVSFIEHCINKIENLKKWVDVEKELEYYFENKPEQETIRAYYYTKKLTREYLQSVVGEGALIRDNFSKDIPAVKFMINLMVASNIIFLNFNYSNMVERIRRQIGMKEEIFNIIYVHGQLNADKDIVFGISDKAKVNSENIFLRKSFDTIQTTQNISGLLLDKNKEIHFFGHSLGETDHSYFENFFKDRIENPSKDKGIFIYHYGERGYQDLFYQIDSMTNHEMTKFKTTNNIKFIDITKPNWENQLT